MRLLAAASLLLTACAITESPDDLASGSGKSDGTNRACTAAYTTWFAEHFDPALRAQPITAARATELEQLAATAPCRGELVDGAAFAPWVAGVNDTVVELYTRQRVTAETLPYSEYVQSSAPAEKVKLAARVLLAARPAVLLGEVEMRAWTELERVVLAEVSEPVIDSVVMEWYWTVNAGEQAMLALVASLPPKSYTDGGYAAWLDGYASLQRDGAHSSSDDDYDAGNRRFGCLDRYPSEEPGPCGRERLLAYRATQAPIAKGELDSERWVHELDAWTHAVAAAAPGSTTAANQRNELARIVALRPVKLMGSVAYAQWLAALDATVTTPDLLVIVLASEPCTDAGEEAYAAFAAAHPTATSDVLSAARPDACAP